MIDNLSPEIKEYLDRDSTKNFLFAARQFVEFLEIADIDKRVFYSKAHYLLINLYSAGHNLELIELRYSSEDKEYDRDTLFENKNAGLIYELDIDEAFYWEVFDPSYSEKDGKPIAGWSITDKEASQGSLVDDFTSIYEDLKIELLKIDKIKTDDAIEDALWELKFSFAHHWGNHCINALRYLHYLRYDGKQTI